MTLDIYYTQVPCTDTRKHTEQGAEASTHYSVHVTLANLLSCKHRCWAAHPADYCCAS
jgi:hypothetical protein